jgi:hypothetical protein
MLTLYDSIYSGYSKNTTSNSDNDDLIQTTSHRAVDQFGLFLVYHTNRLLELFKYSSQLYNDFPTLCWKSIKKSNVIQIPLERKNVFPILRTVLLILPYLKPTAEYSLKKLIFNDNRDNEKNSIKKEKEEKSCIIPLYAHVDVGVQCSAGIVLALGLFFIDV